MRLLGLICAASLLAACGGSSSADPDATVQVFPDATNPDATAPVADASPPDAPTSLTDAFIPTGGHTQYVVDAIDIPTSSAQASACGLNIDGDPMDRIDNALGQIIAALAGAGGADPQAGMDAAIANGSALHLFDVQADSLVTDANVGLRAFFGDDTDGNPADNFSGTEMFDVSVDSPPDALVTGPIIAGSLRLGPGEMSVRVVPFPGGSPVVFPLIGVRIHGSITGGAITAGILGGAITSENVDNVVLPALADNLATVVTADCGGTFPNCCTPGSSGETIVGLFDDDNDCVVTLDEVRNSSLVQSLIAPDLDLLDAAGNFNPMSDGVKESLSLGVCFTAVGAVFTLP